ncbi:MAG: hypothetical protein ACEQSH_00225 [Bacteroidia bacterium]|jgi:hypothetical protein
MTWVLVALMVARGGAVTSYSHDFRTEAGCRAAAAVHQRMIDEYPGAYGYATCVRDGGR